MRLFALDAEYNQPSGSVIEIGVAIGDSDTGQVIDRRSWLVRLPPGEVLNPEITDLTRITPHDLRPTHAHDLGFAYGQLTGYHTESGAHMNPVTWGHGDVAHLRKAIEGCGLPVDDGFGRRTFDAKTLYSSWRLANGKPTAGGLSKAMTKFGMAFDGTKHRAADDAANTLRIYFRLLQSFRMPDHGELIARLRHWSSADAGIVTDEDPDLDEMLDDIKAAADVLDCHKKDRLAS